MIGKNPASLSDDDVFWLLIGGVFLASALSVAAVAGFATSTWHRVVDWLVAHHVLVDGSRALLEVPVSNGAGLDLPRLALLAGAVLVAGAVVVSSLRRSWRRRRLERAA